MRNIYSFTLILVFIGIILLLPGCEVDYYDPSRNVDDQGGGSSLFDDDVTVPDGFDWATTHAVSVDVEVDDRYEGKYYYLVELYDSNPLFNEDATLLDKGVAKKGLNFTTNVVVGIGTDLLFMKQIDPLGIERVSGMPIDDLSVKSAISEDISSLKRKTKVLATLRSATRSEGIPSITVPPTPTSGVLEMSSVSDIKGGNSYVIPSGTTFEGNGTVNDWTSGGTIYVDGTWNVTGNLNLIAYNVVIHRGGKMHFASNHSFTSLGNIIVDEGGEISGFPTITIKNDKGVRPDGIFFANKGIVNVQELLIQGENTLYNFNLLKAVNIKTQNSSNAILYNDKTISLAGDLEFVGSGGKITNYCTLTIGGSLKLNGSTVTLDKGSSIVASNINLEYSTINLFDDAILTAKETLVFGHSQSKIEGKGANFALVKAQKVIFGNWNVFRANGKVALMGDVFENSGKNEWEDSNYATSPAYITSDANALSISGTDCNGGGYNDKTTPDIPTDPEFPLIYDGTSLTYLFEDNWPSLGDYDMNDLVLDVTPTLSKNASNKVTQLVLNVTLRASGATRRLAAGLQLDGITPAMISTVYRSNTGGLNGNVFTQSAGLETEQTYAVIPLFDDVHAAFGLSSAEITNTVIGSGEYSTPARVTFTIHFSNPMDKGALTVNKFNLFLVNGGSKSKRQEVHLPGYQPTDKADKSKFGLADDNSNTKPYTAKNNMIWGLAIPGSAKYPAEWRSISLAYPGLESWATSGGANAKDWYKNSNENSVYNQ